MGVSRPGAGVRHLVYDPFQNRISGSLILKILSKFPFVVQYGRVLGPGTYLFYFVGYLEISTY